MDGGIVRCAETREACSVDCERPTERTSDYDVWLSETLYLGCTSVLASVVGDQLKAERLSSLSHNHLPTFTALPAAFMLKRAMLCSKEPCYAQNSHGTSRACCSTIQGQYSHSMVLTSSIMVTDINVGLSWLATSLSLPGRRFLLPALLLVS